MHNYLQISTSTWIKKHNILVTVVLRSYSNIYVYNSIFIYVYDICRLVMKSVGKKRKLIKNVNLF